MEDHRFDDLARFIQSGRSRRSAIGAMVAVALTVFGSRTEVTDAAARCPRGKERCDGKCRAKCSDVMVRNRRTCACECPDRMHRCGKVCVGQDRCCTGEKTCGGGCISETDCCPYTHMVCPNGSCLEKASGACCPGVEVACDAAPDGCCNAFAGEECSDDGCCNTLVGQSICGGTCVNTDSDPNHCGACGRACRAGCESCENGTCVSTGPCCQSGQTACGGRCVNTQSDFNNCGGCGATCGSCEYCNNGTCTRMCATGWDCCGTISCCEQPGAMVTPGEPRRVPRKGSKGAR